jgi:hypothetical protein
MAVNTRGVFSLEKVREKQIFNDWVNLADVWVRSSPSAIPYRFNDGTLATPNTGYFGGGGFPDARSTMDKVTYSTDTTAAVPGAALSVARNQLAATGNSIAGYFGGGGPGSRSTMDKVTYSTDTTAAVPGAVLSVARYGLAASSSTANAVRGTVPQVPIV